MNANYWILIRQAGIHIESRNNNHRDNIGIADIDSIDTEGIGIDHTEESAGHTEESAGHTEQSAGHTEVHNIEDIVRTAGIDIQGIEDILVVFQARLLQESFQVWSFLL